jgi:hypothetical protein
MKKISVIIFIFVLFSCGMSDTDKEEIAVMTCNIMGESRNMDAAMRIKELNAAREKIGEERYLFTDLIIRKSIEYDLCKELVLNDPSFADKLLLNQCARNPDELYSCPTNSKITPPKTETSSKRIQEIRESVKNRTRND